MKRVTQLVVAMMFVAVFSEFANAQKLPGLDPSPADIAYFRPDGRESVPVIRVIYGRPQKKGRTMLGDKEPFGKVWRLGANEATEIKLYKDVTFGDKKVSAGTYTLYAIPTKDEWTLIFNTKLDTWGAYSYDESKDVARIKVPTGKTDSEVEAFTIAFDGSGGTGKMALAWENTLVTVPLKY
ncbi:DUF2911 domain-containing protein [Fulvivirgaceae bacterium PWU4]|uniref:DUF2911 domain-containing protein n=1 Tax=Chryseosolibacter histidini TaxID=2782349 RepID=A0AAP2DR51_9BACT|nr:DUF2911 domain-containing protein [Chryseosolibacter histidini]MBT1700955.1 DUF2911 domain-containing protein [Chryseosolibacter histidini]